MNNLHYSESKVRVRYAETDQMGIVYHANYYVWFEVGRTDFLRKFGMSYKELEKEGIILPVVETHCRYKIPALYDDVLIVRTTVKELSVAKTVFKYELIREADNVLLAEGETMHAFTNSDKKPVNLKKVNISLYETLSRLIDE